MHAYSGVAYQSSVPLLSYKETHFALYKKLSEPSTTLPARSARMFPLETRPDLPSLLFFLALVKQKISSSKTF